MSDQLTPGQWAVEYGGSANPVITATATEGDLHWQIVAWVRTNEADARLMAAAPELLAWMKNVLLTDFTGVREHEAHALLRRVEGKDHE